MNGLKTRWWLIFLSILLIAPVSVVSSINQKPTYQATSVLMIRQKDLSAAMLFGPLIGQYATGPELSMATQAKLMTTRPMLQEVIDKLKLKIKPDDLAGQVSVTTDLEANMLSVDVNAASPYQAQLIANTLVDVYLKKSKESSVNELVLTIGKVHREVKKTQDRIVALSNKIAKYQGQVPDSLNARKEMAFNNYRIIAEKDEQLKIYKELRTSDAQLVEPAVAPEKPIFLSRKRDGLLGIVTGLLVGVLLALGLEEMDNTLKTAKAVESSFNLPVIGKIPYDKHLAKGVDAIVVRSSAASMTGEAFRAVRTNLEFFGTSKPITAIMVTSANPKEGRSLFAVNIAVAFAQTGIKVILVGCDLRIPSIHKHLDVDNDLGLSAYLAGHESDVGKIIQPTHVENLNVIVSGANPPNPMELLGCKRMADMMTELHKRADLLVFDTPPVLSVADANVISRYADGAIVLCDYARTTKEDAKKIIAALGNTNVRRLGVVINKVPASA